MTTAFVGSISLLTRTQSQSKQRFTCIRPRIGYALITPTMSGKGFGAKPTKPPGKQQKNNQDDSTVSPSPPEESSDQFTPRGPTMRAEYEDRGLMEPSLGPDAGVLPEIVANRMLRRILGFGGVPLLGLFAFFALYFVLKYKYDITVIPVLVAYTTLGTIGFATMGITYGIFSSSWDEEIEGTSLGWKEAQTNFIRAKDGLIGQREKEIREEEFEKIDRAEEERKKRSNEKDSQQ